MRAASLLAYLHPFTIGRHSKPCTPAVNALNDTELGRTTEYAFITGVVHMLDGRLYKMSRVMRALKPGACRLRGPGAAARGLRAAEEMP
jgi:hypothetical protein